jgi:hypothetical protein
MYTPKTPRPLKPRTPNDCQHCRVSATIPDTQTTRPPIRPWRELKNRHGAPKRIDTHGYACPNPDCLYFGITDLEIHALVGDGHHDVHAAIQDLRCQACSHKFSVRRHTALYHLKTADQRVGEVLSALAEGLSMGAAVRVFGHSEATIATWLSRSATHAEKLRTGFFCRLQSLHIQLDELRTTLRDQG